MSPIETMSHRLAVLAVVVTASGLLLASTAPTSNPTTSRLDSATASCIRRATGEKRLCKLRESSATCKATFQTALAACFTPDAGVTCANGCIADQRACEARAQPTVATCRQDRRARGDHAPHTPCKAALEACKLAFTACLPTCPQG